MTKMALLIELVVDLGVNWAKRQQRLQTSKPPHLTSPSPKRVLRILCAIVSRGRPPGDRPLQFIHRRRMHEEEGATTAASMRLQHCAIAISLSMSFATSCR